MRGKYRVFDTVVVADDLISFAADDITESGRRFLLKRGTARCLLLVIDDGSV